MQHTAFIAFFEKGCLVQNIVTGNMHLSTFEVFFALFLNIISSPLLLRSLLLTSYSLNHK